jgi:thiosulfate dehydrogenase (quinone) large subunit
MFGHMNLTPRIRSLDDKLQGWVIAGMRFIVGLLWLANLEWKRPGDFGLVDKNGLYKYIDSAVRLPVFKPYSWFVENVVLKQYRAFGWMTLIMEMLLAALLIVGFKTRWIALVGAGLSISIALSVLNYDKAYEWPWSYYLMFAIHMLLWAVAAGKHVGIDGARTRGRAGATQAWYGLGTLAVVSGLLGVWFARDTDFFAEQGAKVGWKYETNFLWFNMFSAVATVVLGLLLIIGARTKIKALVLLPGVAFAALVVQVLVQWRYIPSAVRGDRPQWVAGFTGATGATAALWLALGIGVFATFRTADKSLS